MPWFSLIDMKPQEILSKAPRPAGTLLGGGLSDSGGAYGLGCGLRDCGGACSLERVAGALTWPSLMRVGGGHIDVARPGARPQHGATSREEF